MPQIILPEKVSYILGTLEAHGFEAYAVGGCVRDALLSREPKDWDVTTSALPGQVKEIFSRTVDTGIQHGTVTVLLGNEHFEVTTYRVDGEYADGRHPDTVSFTPSLLEDLKRRDFTMNAMAYNECDGLVDEFDGIGDLKNGIIRCVGEPDERFFEDALRMLRAVRFAAQLGFEIEENTREAIARLSGRIAMISAERVQAELTLILTSDHPEFTEAVYDLGLSKEFLPEFDAMMATGQNNPHHYLDVGHHTIEVLRHTPPERSLRLAALLHDVAKPRTKTTGEDGIDHFYGHGDLGAKMASEILRRLRFDNDTRERVCRLIRWHDPMPELSERGVRRMAGKVGADLYPDLFSLKRADVMGQSDYKRQEKLTAIDKYERIYGEVQEKGQCLSLKDLAVDGSDLIADGMKPGRELGEMLKHLLDVVIENPKMNTREELLAEARRYLLAICNIK